MGKNIFKRKDSILKYILLGIYSIVVGVGVTFLLSLAFGYKYLYVESNSMSPKYEIGTIVVVNTKVKYENLQIGDVITYKSGSSNVTHRVVSKVNGRVVTQGDANSTIDTICGTQSNPVGLSKDAYVGKIEFGVSKLGDTILTFSQSRNAIIIVVAVVLVLFILIM